MLHHLLFFTCVFSFFILLKAFLIVLHFINSLFKRKSVQTLKQMSITRTKISYFSFSFKLNEKKKVLLKNMVWTGGLQETFCWRGLMFNRGLEIFQKRGA